MQLIQQLHRGYQPLLKAKMEHVVAMFTTFMGKLVDGKCGEVINRANLSQVRFLLRMSLTTVTMIKDVSFQELT